MSNINKNETPTNQDNNNTKEEIKKENEVEEAQQSQQNKIMKKDKKKTNQKDLGEISVKNNNNNNNSNQNIKNDNSIKDNNNINIDENKKNKDNIKLIIKEQNYLLTKEREYLKILENLNLKIKNIEQSNKNELNKLSTENIEKDNRIQILSSTNKKMKESYNLLTQRMDQFTKNISKTVQSSTNLKYPKKAKNAKNSKNTQNSQKSEKTKEEQNLEDKDEEIKAKQKIINFLSRDNQKLKNSIDRFYELDATKNIANELKDKEQLMIKLQKEIEEYEDIVKKHKTQCTSKIQKLKEKLKNIEKVLNKQNIEFHDKNKDYIYLNCKFSLYNKQNEEKYNKIKNKDNYLDMNKHNDFLNYNNINSSNLKLLIAFTLPVL